MVSRIGERLKLLQLGARLRQQFLAHIRLRGLAVACWTTDHYYPCSNLDVGISEGCFIFDFASLPLKVTRPI